MQDIVVRSRARLLAQASVEWVLIIAIVGLGCVAGLRALSGQMGNVLGKTGNVLAQGDPVGPVTPDPGTPGGSGSDTPEPEPEPEPEDSTYAMLYSDGTLVFQEGDNEESSYGGLIGKWNGWVESQPTSASDIKWAGEKDKIRSVVFKDAVAPNSLAWYFSDCDNLESFTAGALDPSRVVSTSNMFSGCGNLVSVIMEDQNFAELRTTREMFKDCSKLFTCHLFEWRTPKLTDMRGTWQNCPRLVDSNSSGWDRSKVTDISYLYFNDKDVRYFTFKDYDYSSVTDMSFMLYGCDNLETLDLGPSFKLTRSHEGWLPDGTWKNDAGTAFTPETFPSGAGTYRKQ